LQVKKGAKRGPWQVTSWGIQVGGGPWQVTGTRVKKGADQGFSGRSRAERRTVTPVAGGTARRQEIEQASGSRCRSRRGQRTDHGRKSRGSRRGFQVTGGKKDSHAGGRRYGPTAGN
jgi:hypothetical protein